MPFFEKMDVLMPTMLLYVDLVTFLAFVLRDQDLVFISCRSNDVRGFTSYGFKGISCL